MPPEYIDKGLITKKLDIFSLGVTIIEVITGHKDYPESIGASKHDFVKNVRYCIHVDGIILLCYIFPLCTVSF